MQKDLALKKKKKQKIPQWIDIPVMYLEPQKFYG